MKSSEEASDRRKTIFLLAGWNIMAASTNAKIPTFANSIFPPSPSSPGVPITWICPKINGHIQVIGTPGEEGDGGKILLAKVGIFAFVDAAMMFHPASKNMVLRRSLASSELFIEFFGKASHAAAAPEEGINALDAMILTFNHINALRPTFGPKDRV